MVKILMITGLLYMGYRLISKPNSSKINGQKDELIEEDFTDYEEVD